jgi:hypothetical protein
MPSKALKAPKALKGAKRAFVKPNEQPARTMKLEGMTEEEWEFILVSWKYSTPKSLGVLHQV